MAIHILIAGLLFALSIAGSNTWAAEPTPSVKDSIVFGVVPQQAMNKLIATWKPLLTYLSETTGKTFKFDSSTEIDLFDERVRKGEFDVVYMNPALYSKTHDSVGYLAIAKEKETELKGLIVIHKDSPITQLSELAGKSMVFPSPVAFAATVLPLAELTKLNIKVTAVFGGSHDRVYNDVARGLFPAGGGVEKTFGQADKTIRDNLKVLWTSDSYAPHPVAVHPRLDRALAEQIQKALVDLEQHPLGKEILKKLHSKGFTIAADADYEKFKTLTPPVTTGAAP